MLKKIGLFVVGWLLCNLASAQILPDGLYVIKSRHSGLFMEISGNSKNDGANVLQGKYDGDENQQFELMNKGGDYYLIRAVHSLKAISTYGSSKASGVNVHQWTYKSKSNQIWKISSSSSGYYHITSKYSDLYLGIKDGSLSSGGDIRQYDASGGYEQQWKFEPVDESCGTELVDGGLYSISNYESELMLDIAAAKKDNGANLQLWGTSSDNALHRQFYVRSNGPHTWTLTARHSSLVLGTHAESKAENANIVQTSGNGDKASQQWVLQRAPGTGAYRIVNRSSGLVMSAAGKGSGANVYQARDRKSHSQRWMLTPLDAKCSTPTSAPVEYVTPTFSDISVHDPSVIYDDGQYYVFGSHLSVARSPDLMHWTRVADGVHDSNPIFNNVTTELSEALSWAQTKTLWAPDVAKINDRYYFYYNACQGDAPISAMGIASSSSIEGYYADSGLILRSGMKGTSEDGTTYNSSVHPNTVDPAVFRDANDKLWMIYGSYSGGIYIMRLNPETGSPYEGQGYGKHLMGGGHSRIEGAYVLYSPESRYYYMFTSFGGLGADGGYNVRVSRSVNPDGPYLDAAGNDMADVKSTYVFDDDSIAPYAVKLMGNHVYSDTNGSLGYVSPGHNSAFYQPDNGQYFIIFHTRFPEKGEVHQVRVHEMFINSDGWPVVAPLRYAPRIDAKNADTPREKLEQVLVGDVPGQYQVIDHGKDITENIKSSVAVELHDNGTLSGQYSGRWQYTGNNGITLDIDNLGSFSGVLSRQWHEHHGKFVVTFSALNGNGQSVWGVSN